MALKLSSTTLVAVCLAASAALFFLGTGLAPVWVLAWLAPIPVLWLAPRVPASAAFLIGAAAFGLGGFNEWYYLRVVTPLWVTLLNAVAPACIFGVAVVLFSSRVVKGQLWQAALVVPAFWVVYEYVTSIVSIHGTIGNISYSQMNCLPILQVAAVAGIWGISFSMLFFAASVAALLSADPRKQRMALACSALIFFVCVFGYGFWRLAAMPKDSAKVKVGLIASDDSDMLVASTVDETQHVFERFGKKMQSLAGQGIQVFVLPEHSGLVTDASEAATDAMLEQQAKQMHAYIAVGVDRITPTLAWNQERLYGPDGTLVGTYNKHHLLPPFENRFTPATTRTTVPETSGKWGLEICKDLDFPRLSREYAQDGVGLMLVPAWDFTMDGWLHGRMAIMRGVEGGFSIARSAKKSIVYATDDRGRVLGERETGFAPFTTVITTIPVHHDATLYTKFGDWFAWLNIALLVGLVGAPLAMRP
ncbi:MAG TPA: nitrilase-related carbon-nitrogen hydrolase [Edaphobacter sp.]|nr:nitrilase-related carbon-nitrogen hydrolase [Edaphobacter sp.]